ncbi:MAG: AraC family transcriptional regulator [Pseudomonadota bacterium]
MTESSVAINYIRTALSSARAAGLDVPTLLAQSGIPPAVLEEARARVSHDQYLALTLTAMRALNDEFMLQGGVRRTAMGTFPLMCRGVIHEPTLQRALVHALHFYDTLLPDMRLSLHRDGENAHIVVALDDESVDPDHVLVEVLLVLAQRFAGWLVDHRIALTRAEFRWPAPRHLDEYRMLFHCPLEFGANRNAISFPARFLSWPIAQTPRTLRRFLRQAPGNLLVIPDNDNSMTAQVRASLGRDFSRELPDFEEVALRLRMTPQTLRRRLREEGASYQEIKDNIRRDAAIGYLARPQLSIMEIAQLMGFSEPSTFHRAFKKWTGLTPGAYRHGSPDRVDAPPDDAD